MKRSRRRRPPDVAPTSQLTDSNIIPNMLVVIFYALSFMSGGAALIYEITWAKMLSLTFGSTTIAASAVIAGFMGGMGVGARWFHLVYKRTGHPLRVYAFLEIGIAVSTALLTLMFYSLPTVFANASHVIPEGIWFVVARFAAVLMLLFVPAALMGATFPAFCTVMIRTVRGVDRHLGMIYGINTIGAAFGALVGGMFLIERLGTSATVYVANAINVLVACVAFMLLRTPLDREEYSPKKSPEKVKTAIPTNLPRWLTGAVLFVSGFATLGYEILWFRALRYSVGNSTYALTTVLVIFLIGLGLGSLLLQRVLRRGSPERDLAMCQCAIGVLAMLAMACESWLLSSATLRDYISIFSDAVLSRPWWSRLLVDAGLATLTMLPPTLFMGLSFPLASRLFLGDVKHVSARTGSAYLLANLGSVSGAVVTAILILPLCGTIGGTKLLAVMNLALGVALALAIRRQASRMLLRLVLATGLVGLTAVLLPSAFTLHGELMDGIRGKVIHAEEGDLATVQVLERPDNPALRTIAIDGYKIGWSAGYMGSPFARKQVMLAHIPMILEPRIRHTLNVGLGSASTLQAMASYTQVISLDCVEINSAVVRAAEYFQESEVLNDRRVNLIVDDVVHYLLRSNKMYDLIVSDGKQNPFFAGTSTLLCRDYYHLVHNRLTDDGLFIQWLPIGMAPFDFQVNLRTLCDVFPYVELFYFPPESVFIVGSHRPLAGRPVVSDEAYLRSPAHKALLPYSIDSATVFRTRWVASKQQLLRLLSETPVSTWDHLLLDFSAFKWTTATINGAYSENLQLMLTANASPSSDQITFEVPPSVYFTSADLMRRACAEYFAGKIQRAYTLARQAVKANPDDESVQGFLMHLEDILRERRK